MRLLLGRELVVERATSALEAQVVHIPPDPPDLPAHLADEVGLVGEAAVGDEDDSRSLGEGANGFKAAFEAISALPEGTRVVFIPDCRFTNEADFVRKMGGEVWRVGRYVHDLRFKSRGRPFDNKLSPEQQAHPSETQLDSYDFDRVLRACNMEELFSRVQGEILRLKSQNKL